VNFLKTNTLVTMMKQKYRINIYYLYYEQHGVTHTAILFEKETDRRIYHHIYSLFQRFGK